MTSTVTMYLGDVRDVLDHLAAEGVRVDFAATSPPFLSLREYLPPGHPDKDREIGSEPTPAAFLDTCYGWTAQLAVLLPEWGSIAVEIGDTQSGSGGAGGDYNSDGLRSGQQRYQGSERTSRGTRRRDERHTRGGDDEAMRRYAAGKRDNPGPGWPMAKSMCLVPHGYTIGLAYGRNPLTGTPSPAGQWRIRNVVTWARPNPPVGSLGKRNPERRTGDQKFRPACSFITVACRGTGRYFDLDAVRTDASPNTHRRNANGVDTRPNDCKVPPNGSNRDTLAIRDPEPGAGVPPLDWHTDDLDGDWLWKLATAPFKGWTETVHRVRVEVDADADGSQRTTSPSCPLHGWLGRSGSSAHDDGRAEAGSIRTEHNGDRPAPTPADGCPPTSSSSDPRGEGAAPVDAAATPHSTTSSRTDHAPSTSPADTPSVQTPPRTGDTPDGRGSSVPHPGTPESSSSTPGSDDQDGTASRIAGMAACKCSWYRDEERTESTSHYATFPLTLPRRLILAMCPARVCEVCGWPSERIAHSATAVGKAHRFSRDSADRADSPLPSTYSPDVAERVTTGWTDCGCSADGSHWRTGRVIDVFGGSGTTAVAAVLEQRDAVLVDIDRRNVALVRQRLADQLRVVGERRTVRYRGRRKVAEWITWTVEAAAPAQADQCDGQTTLLDLLDDEDDAA